MEIIYLKSFYNDIKKIKDQNLKQRLKNLILKIEAAEHPDEIPNILKMKGYTSAYRIRLGDYRLGVFIDEEKIELVRFVKRNDIYKLFP